MILRVLSFRPAEPTDAADRFVRDQVQPALLACKGLRFLYFGRSSAQGQASRVVITVWDDGDPECPSELDLSQQLDFEIAPEVLDPIVATYDARLVVVTDQTEPARIIRLFRGTLHAGELDDFVRDSEAITDSITDFKPHAVFVGSDPPEGIVALSVWPQWEGIVAATGGDVANPIMTRNTQRLKSMFADHFEMVPGTVAGAVGNQVTTLD